MKSSLLIIFIGFVDFTSNQQKKFELAMSEFKTMIELAKNIN